MQAAVIFTGLAFGALLAALGLALWDGFRQVPGLSLAVQAIGWLAGTLLLIAAVFAWHGQGISRNTAGLILMAALAAPPAIRRRHRASWGRVVRLLPALILAGIGFLRLSTPVTTEASSLPVTLSKLAVTICGGLGARTLGEALSELIAPPHHARESFAATYALLTLLVGGTALANLWQRGTVWGGGAGEGGLAGVWMTWSAASFSPRRRPRMRAALTILAALLLTALAAGY
jgi:hypothetical protein